MLASLPMYDLPELQDATDRLWRALAERLDVDADLLRGADHSAAWRSPDLLFSQTCGYPFTHEFAGQLTYVATPNYAADGCDGPNYCSILLARKAAPFPSFRGQRAAINNPDSMSGMLALQLAFAPYMSSGEFFGSSVQTGSHFASMAHVKEGAAEICAIDCVTVALARRHRPRALEGLVEVGRSVSVPGLPYVTKAWRPEVLRAALSDVFCDAALASTREALLLTGFSVLPDDAYDVITQHEATLHAK
jgi:ABC-type phosphate/phosphonate transport system substrate-binding protein